MGENRDWPQAIAIWGETGTHRMSGVGKRTLARARGQRFYCNALSGNSGWNVSVNADMTVSCSCRDLDGEAELGDLRVQSLPEIFAGPRAMHLRRELASGRLPLSVCARCQDLRMASPAEAQARITNYRLPQVMMVENTALCNLNCVSCPRDILAATRRRPSMSLDDIRRVGETIRDHGVRTLVYHKLGEPFLSRRIEAELTIIREIAPDTRIVLSTNGLAVATDRARRAALLVDSIYFSIDGINTPMLTRYQRDGDFDRAYRNLRELVVARDEAGAETMIGWRYILFNWNDRRKDIERAVELARAAGVDYIMFRPTFAPFYGVSWRFFLGLSHPDNRFKWAPRAVWFRAPTES